jgi:hypothetical protein
MARRRRDALQKLQAKPVPRNASGDSREAWTAVSDCRQNRRPPKTTGSSAPTGCRVRDPKKSRMHGGTLRSQVRESFAHQRNRRGPTAREVTKGPVCQWDLELIRQTLRHRHKGEKLGAKSYASSRFGHRSYAASCMNSGRGPVADEEWSSCVADPNPVNFVGVVTRQECLPGCRAHRPINLAWGRSWLTRCYVGGLVAESTRPSVDHRSLPRAAPVTGWSLRGAQILKS